MTDVKEEDGSKLYGKIGDTQVRLKEFKGKQYFDIRKFQGDYPTKKGIMMLTSALPDCISLLEKVEQDLAKKA